MLDYFAVVLCAEKHCVLYQNCHCIAHKMHKLTSLQCIVVGKAVYIYVYVFIAAGTQYDAQPALGTSDRFSILNSCQKIWDNCQRGQRNQNYI